MFNVTGGELFMILLVALIVLGPERLPSAARRVGKMMGQLRDLSEGFKREVSQALDDPNEPIVKPATRPRLTALDGGVATQTAADVTAGSAESPPVADGAPTSDPPAAGEVPRAGAPAAAETPEAADGRCRAGAAGHGRPQGGHRSRGGPAEVGRGRRGAGRFVTPGRSPTADAPEPRP